MWPFTCILCGILRINQNSSHLLSSVCRPSNFMGPTEEEMGNLIYSWLVGNTGHSTGLVTGVCRTESPAVGCDSSLG
jgi:hypothetical protein